MVADADMAGQKPRAFHVDITGQLDIGQKPTENKLSMTNGCFTITSGLAQPADALQRLEFIASMAWVNCS